METPNPTPESGGASTLDRIQAIISGPEPESQPVNEPEVAQNEPADPEPQTESESDGDGPQSEEPQLQTSDLAKYLGIDADLLDVDSDGTVKLKTKVDGIEGAAKLQDLLKSYQLQEHVDKRTREAAEREKAIQAHAQQVEQQIRARIDQVEQLAQVAGNELMGQYRSIDWNTLRQTDPGQYAALQQDFANRKAQLDAVFQHTTQSRQVNMQQEAMRKQAYVQQEAERLPTVIPEWKDQAVAQKESRDLVGWMEQSGYSREAVAALNTSSALDVATFRKAMLYDQMQKAKPQVENKVRQAPKLVKPGQPVQNTKAQELQNIKQSIRKSGGKRGIAEYLIASGKV